MAKKHPLDGTEPSSNAGGRPPALKPEHIAILHDIVTERAQASLQEIADELHRRCGLRVCDATIRRALRAQGTRDIPALAAGLQGIFVLGWCWRIRADAGPAARAMACTYGCACTPSAAGSTHSPHAPHRRAAKVDSMQARRSRDENAISSSIRWGYLSQSR